MAKRKPGPQLHRGRFQAQGDGLEKSRAWAKEDVPDKNEGHTYIKELKGQLTPSELEDRKTCFLKASQWVDNAPANGYVVVEKVIKTSFLRYPPKKGIRVDGEIHSGGAFKN